MIPWSSAAARSAGGAALTLALLTAAAPLRAQVPPPPQRDTVPVPRDTAAADSLDLAPDTALVPAVVFPAMALAPRVSAAGTVWVWDRETLLRSASVSLVDLLERVPGITTFRAGTFVQPEAASSFGGTAARTEVVLDGYVLDPLAGSTFDLSQIAIGHMREVRVERRLGLLRIVLTTEHPVEGRPHTRVEAGIGVPAANQFRGLFLVPDVIVGPLGLAIERLDTDGIGRAEPAGLFSGWAKWAWTDGDRGIQLEWMRGTLRREPSSPWLVERVRQDIVLRGRTRLGRGLTTEVFAGRSEIDETVPPADAADPEIASERVSWQAGARAGLELPWALLNASVRYRSLSRLPVMEARLDAESAVGPLLLGAEVSTAAWTDSYSATYGGVRAEVAGPFGTAAFGEYTRGTRGAPAWADSLGEGVLQTDRSGWRAGVSLDLGRAAGSAALISVAPDFAWPFGLPFDAGALPLAVSTAKGIEAHGRVVLWPGLLTLSSWITDWRESGGAPYLPARSWRTALELHWIPLESGNLEIFGRGEAHLRGSVLAYDPDNPGGTLTLPSFTTADGYLQIRIIDVRIFIRWEDVLGADLQELPGRTYRGPRIFYGVKWDLWN